MNKKTREMVLAAILTALSILITYSPVKIPLPFFTLTAACHTPTMIAMLINPWVTIMTIIGTCLGFLIANPVPNPLLVAIRAATHIIFALVGCKMIKERKFNIYVIILVTAILHALLEGVVVYALTPLFVADQAALPAAGIAAGGTFVHHFLDCAITAPIAVALGRAKIISKLSLKLKIGR